MAHEQDHRYLSLRNQSSTVALQHLRYAVLSAEYGSFRRAADALFMQQSTLSRCIRQLEESIGADTVRAIERRRMRNVDRPEFSSHGAVNFGTHGCAGYIITMQRARRS
ncbi:helix-turn-helix domain-containing protein [Bradyrhizobium sp. AZCC 1578]|uniref:helix-turn-helix domain-containing protein n=1 Tax=Bradyrhizobium sp. AZCC 1578 TaxID=3117027 RepID=UPI002FF40D00